MVIDGESEREEKEIEEVTRVRRTQELRGQRSLVRGRRVRPRLVVFKMTTMDSFSILKDPERTSLKCIYFIFLSFRRILFFFTYKNHNLYVYKS